MVSDYQNRMAHCHLSFLLAAASGDPVVLRAQILILGVRGTVCGFDQAVAQPRTAFARAAGAMLTCRFVVPHARPRRQMTGASKAAHVPAGFRPQHFCRAPVHSGNRVEPPDLLLKRAQSLLDLAAEAFDSSFQIIDLRQMLGDQKALMGGCSRHESACTSWACFSLSRPLAKLASCSMSLSPATSASSISRAETPSMSLTTLANLMLAPSSTFCRRLIVRLRSRTREVR